MKLARVVGRVVLSKRDESLNGGVFVLASPFDKAHYKNAGDVSMSKSQYNLVVYDAFGATVGDVIGYVEGAEAMAAFPKPVPVDAYNVGIVEKFSYSE